MVKLFILFFASRSVYCRAEQVEMLLDVFTRSLSAISASYLTYDCESNMVGFPWGREEMRYCKMKVLHSLNNNSLDEGVSTARRLLLDFVLL